MKERVYWNSSVLIRSFAVERLPNRRLNRDNSHLLRSRTDTELVSCQDLLISP